MLSLAFCWNNIISASLSIKAQQSAHVIDLSLVPCLSAHRCCGKMADWICMPFGMVSGVRLAMIVFDFGGDRWWEWAVWG